MIHRVRSIDATSVQSPKSISEIVFPLGLTLTYNKELFVWKDSGYMYPD